MTVAGPGKPGRLPQPLVDRVVAGLVLVSGVLGATIWAFESSGFAPVDVGGYVLAIVQSVPLLWRREHPLRVLAIVAAAFVVFEPLASPVPPAGLLVALYSVGAYAPRGSSLWTIGAGLPSLAAYLLARATWITTRIRVADVATFVPAAIAVWAIGSSVGARRAYTQALEERAVLLEQRRVEDAARAVQEERRRIARELHDVVAHHVGMMVVQAGGARLGGDEQRAREVLEQIEDGGRSALTEMRRLLGVLRDGAAGERAPQPGLARLEELIEQSRASGVAISLTVEGEVRDLPPGPDLSAFRIVQESLTNVAKHAGPASVAVRVSYGPSDVTIEVTDDGAARVGATGEAGNGLIGMRERVALFGGDLQAGPRVGGGFTVRAYIPTGAERA